MGNETELDLRPLLLRRFAWDIFPHDFDLLKEIQGKLGLVPDDDDGMEVEHAASDIRINRVAPLSDTLQTLSGIAAEVMAQYLCVCVEDDADEEDIHIPGDVIVAFETQNTEVINDGATAIISHLLDTGVLVYGPKVRRQP